MGVACCCMRLLGFRMLLREFCLRFCLVVVSWRLLGFAWVCFFLCGLRFLVVGLACVCVVGYLGLCVFAWGLFVVAWVVCVVAWVLRGFRVAFALVVLGSRPFLCGCCVGFACCCFGFALVVLVFVIRVGAACLCVSVCFAFACLCCTLLPGFCVGC